MSLAVAIPLWLDRPPLEALEVAAAAERADTTELWIGEMATFDAFALAGAVAISTENLTLTVGPLAVTVRDPVSLAMGISSVAELGGRPAHLALGASSAMVTRGWHGHDASPSALRFREVIGICRTLFRGERCDVVGETLHTSGFRLRIGQPEASIAMAAFGPTMLNLAAELADRVVLAHVTPRQVRRVRDLLDAVALQSGRTPPELVVWTQTGVGADAVEQIRQGLTTYLAARGYAEMFTEEGFGPIVELARTQVARRSLVDAVPQQLVNLVAAAGEPEQARHAIEARYEAGADQVVIVPATASQGGLDVLFSHIRQ